MEQTGNDKQTRAEEAMAFLEKGIRAEYGYDEPAEPESTEVEDSGEGDADASAFAEDLRSEGVAVTQKPKKAAAAQGDTSGDDSEESDAELEALASEAAGRPKPPEDPRAKWREGAIQRMVTEFGMPEEVARTTVSNAKKAAVQSWLDRLDGVKVSSSPRGQAPGAPHQSSAESQDDSDATPSEGQPDDAGHVGMTATERRIAALEARLQAQDAAQFAVASAAAKEGFTRAGKKLAAVFPRLQTADGKIDPEVLAAARALRSHQRYAVADHETLLRAAASAVYSIGPGSTATQKVRDEPRTPVSNGVDPPRRPMSRDERTTAIMRVLARHGDPGHLTPEQNAKAQAEIKRMRKANGW